MQLKIAHQGCAPVCVCVGGGGGGLNSTLKLGADIEANPLF